MIIAPAHHFEKTSELARPLTDLKGIGPKRAQLLGQKELHTLMDLLLGLVAPTRGEVLVDGVVLDEAGRRGWRSSIGYVPQQPFLLDDTLARNIAFSPQAFLIFLLKYSRRRIFLYR